MTQEGGGSETKEAAEAVNAEVVCRRSLEIGGSGTWEIREQAWV